MFLNKKNIYYWLVFGAIFFIALGFAMYTNHAWEDWYITYRASKNLALGHGLVFTIGQKVHSFTSPLGVLIPALLALVFKSDDLVLWLFRIVSCSLLGLTAVYLLKAAKATKLSWPATFFLLLMFGTNLKIIDFSINGMETALMMFFLSMSVYCLIILSSPHASVETKYIDMNDDDNIDSRFRGNDNQKNKAENNKKSLFLSRLTHKNSIYLGLAWAGLMWTRPDSFIYIAATALGFLIFYFKIDYLVGARNDKTRIASLSARNDMPTIGYKEYNLLKTLLKAGFIACILYLPWLIWAWYYYGSPIPHTIIAKGLINFSTLKITSIINFLFFPALATEISSKVFMPAYYSMGDGWPNFLAAITNIIFSLSCLYWLYNKGNKIGRAISLATWLAFFYLFIIPYAYPWYFPSIALPSIIVLAFIIQDIWQSKKNTLITPYFQQIPAIFLLSFVVSLSVFLAITGAYQLKIQQQIIEQGQRKQIGLWLKNHASSSNDTVFLECLGYIGFYSQLKMYDFPGLSSPEVLEARKLLHTNSFAQLINYLTPNWLVLRPYEIEEITSEQPDLLKNHYQPVEIFDVAEKLNPHAKMLGIGYLKHDQSFTVFKKTINEK